VRARRRGRATSRGSSASRSSRGTACPSRSTYTSLLLERLSLALAVGQAFQPDCQAGKPVLLYAMRTRTAPTRLLEFLLAFGRVGKAVCLQDGPHRERVMREYLLVLGERRNRD